MNPRVSHILAIDPNAPDPAVLARAASLLQRGQLVAFPTETVYGLGANALDAVAVQRIYEAKGRPSHNPLIVHVADTASAQRLVTVWPEAAERLARRWWPGPLTIVLPKAIGIPAEVTAGLGTVALRVPAHPVALALLRACGFPLAAPSANRSGEISPTTALHVAGGLGERVPMILDGGSTAVGIESTVVDLSGPDPTLLRPGMISRDELEEEIGTVSLATAPSEADAPRPSPGMLDRHYAPKARLILLSGEGLMPSSIEAGARIGALMRSAAPPEGTSMVITLPDDAVQYAHELYDALHRLDAAGATVILVEPPPAMAAWDGIRDRLERAART
jgi:L-threonylcarbamoyladenylate synthase